MKSRPFPPMPEEVRAEVVARGIDIHGKSGVYQLHHCILSKKHVQGMNDSERQKIHNRVNLMLVPSEDNASHAKIPTWREAYRMQRRHYTKHEIHQWFNSIVWRDSPPFRLPED